MQLRGKPSVGDNAFRWLAIGAAALVLLVLGLILFVMASRALPVISKMGRG